MPPSLPPPKVWPAGDSAWQIRLPLPWTLTSVNAFLFSAESGFLLLDTGLKTPESLAALESSLASLGVAWGDIAEVLVSHLHPDHVGAAAEIRRRSGARVRMPSTEAGLVRPLGPGEEFFAKSASFLRGHGMPVDRVRELRRRAAAFRGSYERLVVDAAVSPGDQMEFRGGTLEAVAAPGHSPGLLCFYCPEQRILFSTDAVLPMVTPNIGMQWFYQSDPLGDYLDTLSRLERLDVDLVAPSHGRPFEEPLRKWVAGTRRHHIRRCETILASLSDGPLTGYEVAGAVWGGELSLPDRRFAMSEGLSHLEFMARDGRVDKRRSGGTTRWARM